MINPNNLDLNLLRVFDALLREKSVSGAAERLHLSQPALSNALNRLRDALQDPLFVRTRNGMEPTALAIQLQVPLQQGLSAIRAALEQGTQFDPADAERTFTLIMNDVGEITFLPPLLRHISRHAPGITLNVVELGREEYEDSLDSGSADLAIGRIKLAETFRSQLVHFSTYVAVMSADHPLADQPGDKIDFDSYMTARHVAVIPRGATGNPIDKSLGTNADQRHIALSVPHTTVLSAILPDTDLVATVPDKCIEALCIDGRLVWRALPFPVEPNMVYQWWHKRQESDAGHRWLRELVANANPPDKSSKFTL
jgi:DNA-binding transcriptional LysR family regulator